MHYCPSVRQRSMYVFPQPMLRVCKILEKDDHTYTLYIYMDTYSYLYWLVSQKARNRIGQVKGKRSSLSTITDPGLFSIRIFFGLGI